MNADRRRRSGVVAALVADPWRKLLAVGLAVLLWLFVDSRIERTTTRLLPLVIDDLQTDGGAPRDRLAVVLPGDRVVGLRFLDGDRPIDQVRIRLRGPRYRVEAIENERLDLRVSVFQDRDWSSSAVVEFTVADVRRDLRALEDLRLELDPPRVKLEVERIDRQEYPLSLDIVDLVEGSLADRLRRETAEFVPDTAVVLGSAIGIDRLRRASKPFRGTLRSSSNNRQATAELELVDGERLGVRFAAQPLLTMQLLPQTSVFQLDVPILVDDIALPPEQRGQWQPEQRSMLVRVRAGGDLRSRLVSYSESVDKQQLTDWVSENLRLYVHIQRPVSGAVFGPELSLKAWLQLVGPMRATVERTECLLAEVVIVKLRQKQQ